MSSIDESIALLVRIDERQEIIKTELSELKRKVNDLEIRSLDYKDRLDKLTNKAAGAAAALTGLGAFGMWIYDKVLSKLFVVGH